MEFIFCNSSTVLDPLPCLAAFEKTWEQKHVLRFFFVLTLFSILLYTLCDIKNKQILGLTKSRTKSALRAS